MAGSLARLRSVAGQDAVDVAKTSNDCFQVELRALGHVRFLSLFPVRNQMYIKTKITEI